MFTSAQQVGQAIQPRKASGERKTWYLARSVLWCVSSPCWAVPLQPRVLENMDVRVRVCVCVYAHTHAHVYVCLSIRPSFVLVRCTCMLRSLQESCVLVRVCTCARTHTHTHTHTHSILTTRVHYVCMHNKQEHSARQHTRHAASPKSRCRASSANQRMHLRVLRRGPRDTARRCCAKGRHSQKSARYYGVATM